jgi:hypothetical protein
MSDFQFTDANGTVNFFDKNRLSSLAEITTPVLGYMWPKAKQPDITYLNQHVMRRLLELTSEHDVLTAEGRANVSEFLTNELNLAYNYKCKLRVSKNGKPPTKKQLDAHKSTFMQYVSLLAFIIFGEIKQQYKLVMA